MLSSELKIENVDVRENNSSLHLGNTNENSVKTDGTHRKLASFNGKYV